MLSRRFSAGRDLHFTVASSARFWAFALSRQGRRAARELMPLGPCFPGLHWSRPGFTLPGQTEQTQPQPCSNVCGLGWHSMPTTFPWRKQGFAFGSGVQVDPGTRPVPSPQERRGDRICALCPCPGIGSCGGLSPLLPRHTPCHRQRCRILEEDGI